VNAATSVPLACQNLTLHLGGVPVVDGISAQLQAGQWLAVVGPNGAGKSTWLSLLAGLRAASAGQVVLMGKPLAAWPAAERAQQLAWLSQQGEAEGEITALDVVRLGRLPRHGLFGALTLEDHSAVQRAMAQTECTAFAARRLNDLSGGERQRVLLARALAVEAPVLLLDEPTTHLDAPHQRALLRCLRARADAGVAVVSVLHDLTSALAADRVLVMQHGRICADGAPADAGLRHTLEAVFEHAFCLQSVALHNGSGSRWVAVPNT
jgi:iron complex transport system ATP-binding protein